MDFAFQNLPVIKDREEAVFSLNALYDEFMGLLPQYTPEIFQFEPYALMRAWDLENPYKVSREKQDMRYYIEKKISETIPGMTYEAFKNLTTLEREWLNEILSTPSPEVLAARAEMERLQRTVDKK